MSKEITLKESEKYESETLDHCLTVIQGVLDMDDYEQAYKYLNSFIKGIIDQTREETIREVEEVAIEIIKNIGECDNSNTDYWEESLRQSLINLRK